MLVAGQAELEPMPSHPLPLLPADVPASSGTPGSQDMRYSASTATAESLIPEASHPTRDHGRQGVVGSKFSKYNCLVPPSSLADKSVFFFWLLVDIREVPSEMPMYLLAEDEGNEEEILRLLETESPRQSPQDNSCRTGSGDATNEPAMFSVSACMHGTSTDLATHCEYLIQGFLAYYVPQYSRNKSTKF